MSYEIYDENHPYERDGVISNYYPSFPKAMNVFDVLNFLVNFYQTHECDNNISILKASGTFKFLVGVFSFCVNNNYTISPAQNQAVSEIYTKIRQRVVSDVIEKISRDAVLIQQQQTSSKKRVLQ